MDFPWIYWLLPAPLFDEWTRQSIVDNWPCWAGGYCH